MDADLSLFFDPADGNVVLCTRSRLLVDDVDFHAIIGITDEEAFDGRVLAAHRTIAFATGPDVQEGDSITVIALHPWQVDFAGTYRVHQKPSRVNDGAESRAVIVVTTS